MKNFTIILLSIILTASCQTSRDFSTPKILVETFLNAASEMDKDVLSTCFSDRSPGEWDKIRNKTISKDDLQEIKAFVSGAEIKQVEMKSDSEATVFVTFTSRAEQIHVIREKDRWFILDF